MIKLDMPKYDISDIQTITAVEAIRLRPWMYVFHPENPLMDIINTFTNSFLHLGLHEFSVCQDQNFFIIKSKEDWLDHKTKRDIEYYFQEILVSGAPQGEVFLNAFYYPFYTRGDVGEYGKPELLNKYLAQIPVAKPEEYGRTLIISKEQQLPENHGIKFERPEKSIDELENEKRYIEAAIQSKKMRQ